MHQHDEIVPIALLVAQEQVLAMRRIDSRPMLHRLLDRRDRRVLEALERNRQLIQARRD